MIFILDCILRYDKAIKDCLFKYIGALEETLKTYIFSNYELKDPIVSGIKFKKHLLNEDFINRHKHQLYMIGISVDSLDYTTNIKMGRCNCGNVLSKEKIMSLAEIIKKAGIKLKINTCLTKFNINEDFDEFINEIKPDRFKILQMVNSGEKGQYEVEDAEIEKFLSRMSYKYIFESACEIQNSYLIIDSKGNLTTNNLHSTNLSVLTYDIEEIISNIRINYLNYIKRYIE